MITTNDGVVKKRGDRVWSIGRMRGKTVPSLFQVHGSGPNNDDDYLKMKGCWDDRDKCLEACKADDERWNRGNQIEP